MAEKKINKHELKTKETRELLLRSAETIFVRDGYEGAELGEIAALAGRTKGAIYAHFESKEDIFLALVEQRVTRYRTQMQEMLVGSKNVEESLAALRQLCLKLTEDQAWALLFLEFKLFAIRHPESKERLRRVLDEVMPEDHEKRLAQVFGPAGKGKDGLRRSVAVPMIAALLSALAVESKFRPTLLDDSVLRKLTNRIFDALIQPSLHAAER
jgi:AcrR family transcriptional regulator